jgi:hypothetical protein
MQMMNEGLFRIWTAVLTLNSLENEESLLYHLTCYTLPVVEMAHSSNVIIHGSTFNSALHIDDQMKDFIPC